MRFRTLGPLQVEGADQRELSRPTRRRLLSLLLLDLGRSVRPDVLIDRMWGDHPPATARNSLQVHILGLRKALPDRIKTNSDGYVLSLEPGDSYDVVEFESHAAEAAENLRAGRLREAGKRASLAIDLWLGPPYVELDGVEAANGDRQRLIELHTSAITNRAKALTLQGRVSESIGHLRDSVIDHPLNEALWEELVLAYHLAGRPSDAIAAFNEASRTLGETLGVVPGPRLRALESNLILSYQHPADGESAPHNLPANESSFVGRVSDLAAVSEALRHRSLVTIGGDHGIGKSRLATETARSLLPRFPGGIWLVGLNETQTEQDLVNTIISVVGIEKDIADAVSLFRELSRQRTLLILDGCELASDVVREAVLGLGDRSDLCILATSRAGLGVAGEVIFNMAGLGVPNSVENLWESDTMKLLADRVASAEPSLDLSLLDPEGLFELCRRSGGVPLTLEQAARWLPSLDPGAVVELIGSPTDSPG